MQSPRTSPTSHRSPCAPVSAHHHHLPIRVRVVAAAVVASVGMGAVLAGPALADPEQPGVTDTAPAAPEQPGVTNPQPAPEPAPEPAPVPDYPQGVLPSPPQEVAPVIWEAPSGPPATSYDPAPSGPIHAPVPTAPVAPKIVEDPAAKIRIGNFVTDRPAEIPRDYAVSINEYSAYAEAKIAQAFRSVGFSDEEADRRAAAAVLGGVIGGVAGATAAGVPVTIAVGLFTLPAGAAIGAAIGSAVPPQPFNIGTGALIGLGAGAAVAGGAGAVAAVIGGTTGAIIGAALGYALGAGDPNANPAAPWETPPPAPAPAPAPAPLPNPGANQYELVLDAPTASDAGLPAVEYTVNTDGDVNFSANIAGIPPVEAGWTAEQAAQPYEVLGQWAEPTKQAVASVTKQVSDGLTSVVDGLHIAYPQTVPAP
ncbi:hypothetical protein DFR67_12651 [Williamsia limnetica]|uniref:Uncharacterized protein n=1 Tax=Williamsia limnetica TaxID=882452 RepID=A0A318R8Y0_WILLI|nr:hypothetical protein DFR67_12651 [Williamsia limnetica]